MATGFSTFFVLLNDSPLPILLPAGANWNRNDGTGIVRAVGQCVFSILGIGIPIAKVHSNSINRHSYLISGIVSDNT